MALNTFKEMNMDMCGMENTKLILVQNHVDFQVIYLQNVEWCLILFVVSQRLC